MIIFIAGGGRVGYYLARLLSSESHDIYLIETDKQRIGIIENTLDVKPIQGNGADALLLQQQGVSEADLFVASMGNDEINLIAAGIAKGLGAKTSVARVDSLMYVKANIIYESQFGIDYILSPDALAAADICNYIENPGVLASETLGKDRIHMRQIDVAKTPTTGGKTIRDVIPPNSGVLLAVIERKGEVFIPHGNDTVEVGDHLILVGHKDKLPAVQRLFLGEDQRINRIAIMGATPLAFHLVSSLGSKSRQVKVLERRPERCQEFAEKLGRPQIVCRDATSRSHLQQENIQNCEVFIATTNDDERNILAAVLAKEMGAKKVIAIVQQPDFAPLVERIGIDMAVTPRASVANRIMRMVHREVTSFTVVSEGKIEIIETAVHPESALVGVPLREAARRLPADSLIAGVVRNDRVIIPSGDTVIEGKDVVIIIAKTDVVEAARKLVQEKAENGLYKFIENSIGGVTRMFSA